MRAISNSSTAPIPQPCFWGKNQHRESEKFEKERRQGKCILYLLLLYRIVFSEDSENETTESSTTEKETVDENTDTPENTEDNKEESEQEPELSEEEKHAALLEKINTQQETCKMLNDMNMGNKYSCFYDESTNTFTYNMDVSGAADFVPSDAFNDLINSTDFSASSNHI